MGLDEQAITVVKQWMLEPAKKDGVPGLTPRPSPPLHPGLMPHRRFHLAPRRGPGIDQLKVPRLHDFQQVHIFSPRLLRLHVIPAELGRHIHVRGTVNDPLRRALWYLQLHRIRVTIMIRYRARLAAEE